LIRHSSILGNDDEFEETMEPFIKKITKLQKKGGGKRGKKGKTLLPSKGDWAFLKKWESPIVEENLEVLSERGKIDAAVSAFPSLSRASTHEQDLGKYFRHQYDPLFPPPYKVGKNSSRIAHKVGRASFVIPLKQESSLTSRFGPHHPREISRLPRHTSKVLSPLTSPATVPETARSYNSSKSPTTLRSQWAGNRLLPRTRHATLSRRSPR
jgi:hypothetical protein